MMTTIGYVLIDHFAVAIERRQRPELCGQPVIIGGYPRERKTVYDASREALHWGVKPGLALRHAEHLCPNAIFLPKAEDRYQEAAADFLSLLESFSPAVEAAAAGSAYFDARGLQPLFGRSEQLARRIVKAVAGRLGLMAQVALAPTRFSAQVAAERSTPENPAIVTALPSEFLAALPVGLLCNVIGQTTSTLFLGEQLRLLGVRTIGQFMRLPSAELQEQFGPAGVQAYHLAYGDDDPPLLPRNRLDLLEQSRQFEPPLPEDESLVRGIDRLSAALAKKLQARGQACQTVLIRLEYDDGEAIERMAQLKEPISQEAMIADVAKRTLSSSSFAYSDRRLLDSYHEDKSCGSNDSLADRRVTAIRIVAGALSMPIAGQLSLFDAHHRRNALERAAAEVQRRFGDGLKRAERAPAMRSIVATPFVLRDYFE